MLGGFWIGPVQAQSYPTQYVATVWTTEQGLPQNSVNALLQDHDGYLWIATFGGLVRFDGERFRVVDSTDLPGLRSVRIISLYETHSGELWIGTAGAGLSRLVRGVATTYTERDGLPSGFINSIRGDAEGNVWINTSGGLAHFAGAKLTAYPTYRGKPVREFYFQARDGSMWFRYGKEVLCFRTDGSIDTMDVAEPSVFLVHEAANGGVWIAVRDAYRLVRYYRGRFSDVRLPPLEHREWLAQYPEYILTMTDGADGNLLLLTPAGLVRTTGGALSAPEPLPLPANAGELPKVRSLLLDRDGNLWVGTIGSGLLRLRPAPLTAYGKNEGLSDSGFHTVFQDREGRIWLGGDQLYWFDGHRFHMLPGVANIISINQTRDGDLWFGGYGGLYRWRSGTLSHFEVEGSAVSVIFQDREGVLWIGAARENRPGGLFRLRDGKSERISGIPDANEIVEDRDGDLRVLSSDGMFRLRAGKALAENQLPSVPYHIVSAYQDSKGTFWLATQGGGLVSLRGRQMKAITTKNGLPSNTLVGMLDDGRGNLWVSSNQNILRFSLEELNDFVDGKTSSVSLVSFGIAEGMRTSECNGGNPGIWKTTDGRIWFPTLHGVVAIDPRAGNPLPPPVVVEEASAEGLMLAHEGTPAAPAGNNTFDFRFTALSLSAPERVRFKYRLDPYDKDWVDAGTRRTAHYTNMAPGEYSFHVIAANNYGIWNREGEAVRFVLRPHFYQTTWFYAFCVATSLALPWLAYQLRLRQLDRAFNRRLAERVEERTRIARELHDTLLQSFQGSLYRFQAARNLFSRRPDDALNTLEAAIKRAEDALAEGRDAIQNLRVGPVEARLEDLLATTGQELADAQDRNGNSAVFRVTTEGQPRTLSPMLGDEVYRIAREVLRNAFQHARARQIEAAIQYDPKIFCLRIRDDGKGMDAEVLKEGARAGHWGLPGMRERAKRIGARFTIWSENGAGTEVELTVPARLAYQSARPSRKWGPFRKKMSES